MKLKKQKLLNLLLVFILPFITGCVTQNSDIMSKTITGTGKVIISMTDDVPLQNIQRLEVKIAEVSLKRVLTDESEEWILVNQDIPMFNIMDYRNGLLYLLGNKTLPPGHYTQIRLKFEQAVLVKDSILHDMDIPQSYKDGVTYNYEFDHVITADMDLVADLDIEGSVIENNGKYTFEPRIRITEKKKAGSISGRVSPKESHAKVIAYDKNGVKVSTTLIRDDGSFVLSYLPPGTYNLVVIANGYEINTSAKNIPVQAGIITPGININLAGGL
jgi:hypothetical protein